MEWRARGMIDKDFAFRGIPAANELSEFRDHGPDGCAAGTTQAERAHAAPARRQGTPKRKALPFAAFKNHLSYLPHSGSVFPQLKHELAGYTTSSGALRFDIGHPLPAPLVQKLIAVRIRQAFPA